MAGVSNVLGRVAGAVYDNTLGSTVKEKASELADKVLADVGQTVRRQLLGAARSLKNVMLPSQNSDEQLRQAMSKIEAFRKRQPIGTTPHTPPRLPPLALPARPAHAASPATPARGAEVPSPRVSTREQERRTELEFGILERRSEIYSTLWMMHPAAKLSADNVRLHDITRRAAGGMEGTLWQEYMHIFEGDLSFFQKCKAKVLYWICYDFGIFKTIIPTLGNNVLRAARGHWAKGETSREPIVDLVSDFIRAVDFQNLKKSGQDLPQAARLACAQFLKAENGFLDGLSLFQRLVVRWFFPGIFENLLTRTLDKMKTPEFRVSFMARLSNQATAHYAKLLTQEPGVSTNPARLPSLDNFFDALRLNPIEKAGIAGSEKMIKATIQMGLEYLISHPEQVEWMLTDLIEKSSTAFNAPSTPVDDAQIETAKRDLGSRVELLLSKLTERKLARSLLPKGAPQTLSTACTAQKTLAVNGLDFLATLLGELRSMDPQSAKFSSQLATAVDFLGNFIKDLGDLEGSLKSTHLLSKEDQEAFDEIFSPLYRGVSQVVDFTLQLQDLSRFYSNSDELMRRFDALGPIADDLAAGGEGFDDKVERIKGILAELSQFLPEGAVEIQEGKQHLAAMQSKNNLQQSIRAFKKWAEEKQTAHSQNRNISSVQIHELLRALLEDHQEGDTVSGSSVDVKHSPAAAAAPQSPTHKSTNSAAFSLELLKELVSKKPVLSPTDQFQRLEALRAVMPNPEEDAARLGRAIADKAIDLLINDPQGQLYRAAACVLLKQYAKTTR